MLKVYQPGEVRFLGTPRIVGVPKKKFNEFLKNYSYPLDKRTAEMDGALYTCFVDEGLDTRTKYGAMAYSIEYPDKSKKNAYYVVANYKFLHDTYDETIELQEK